MKKFFLVMCALSICPLFAVKVNKKGYWEGEDACQHHFFDNGLVIGLEEFFLKENAHSIVDFGCGMGDYVKHLSQKGFFCHGFDGNPKTALLTKGFGQVQDLSVPFQLAQSYDWVLSLEVGEHLPQQYETIFIENLVRHCTQGIVLSWAVKGQGGHGHFNEQNNDYIRSRLASYGFANDIEAENILRKQARAGWFHNTIMVFRKK
ncbi:MAG: hypothetical protein JSR76_07710 [Verrucomicrobia bacterium]|nr:hypothetical protein [Verrucomicrobiota bacterium]